MNPLTYLARCTALGLRGLSPELTEQLKQAGNPNALTDLEELTDQQLADLSRLHRGLSTAAKEAARHVLEGRLLTGRAPASMPGATGGGLPMPVYRATDGRFRPITGRHARNWPHPRVIEVGDALFVEWPMPPETGWSLTFHAVRPPRTRLGRFLAHYIEGRSSGFPWWPVVVFSARWSGRRRARRAVA